MKQVTAVEWLEQIIYDDKEFSLSEVFEQAKEMEKKIADEFAIGFVKFINETDSFHHGENAFHFDGKWHTHEEFLEVYKKEKGL